MLETNRFTLHYLAISACCLAISFGLIRMAYESFYKSADKSTGHQQLIVYISAFLPTIFVVPCFLLSGVCFLLAWLPISRHHTLTTAIAHVFLLAITGVVGVRYWSLFEKATKNPRQKQDQLLEKILSDNANTEYGKVHGFANIKDRENYKAKHRLTTYENYRSYTERIADNGEQNLLTRDDVDRFNVSSGTTGKCKLLPSTSRYFSYAMTNIYIPYLFNLTRFKKAPFFAPLKSSLFLFVPRWRFSKCGFPIGPASGFTPKQRSRVITLTRTLPLEAEEVLNEPAQCYLHWLFSLYDDELIRFDCTFGGAVLSSLEFLQKYWPQLVTDIRRGRISRNIPLLDIPVELIERVEKAGRVWSDPKRADQLQKEFSRGFQGIFARLWPRLNLIVCTITGSHAIYQERLNWYCGPGVRLYTSFFGASEGIFGMNADPQSEDEQLFTLQPHMTFMEFIPEEYVTATGGDDPPTVFMDQVEANHRYELVITSILGFYRYRIGDVVEVVRFRHGKTPIVRFCGRVGSILDLRGEKTSEDMVYTALLKAVANWNGCGDLKDYTTTECVSLSKAASKESGGDMGEEVGLRYVLFVEIEGLTRQLSAEEIAIFDVNLSEVSYPYKSFRLKRSIGEPKIYVVKKGTFLTLKDDTLARNNAVSNQYKTPRYLTDKDRLQFLLQASY